MRGCCATCCWWFRSRSTERTARCWLHAASISRSSSRQAAWPASPMSTRLTLSSLRLWPPSWSLPTPPHSPSPPPMSSTSSMLPGCWRSSVL
ncbi:hypothetical protein LEMLEM_LOCUS7762 [Lemmus lemmus]